MRSAWARRRERGTEWRLRLVGFLYRRIGRNGMDLLLLPIAAESFLSSQEERRVSRDWIETVWRFPGGR